MAVRLKFDDLLDLADQAMQELDDTDQVTGFIEDLGAVLTKYFGGKIKDIELVDDRDIAVMRVEPDHDIPEDGGIWKLVFDSDEDRDEFIQGIKQDKELP